mgnify:CR=1 FL=1
MKITLLVVGKTTDNNINILIDNYLARLKFYTDFAIQVIPELKNAKNMRQEEQKEKDFMYSLQHRISISKTN